ncbi:MAG: fatty acid desaturase family protein [Bacteroidia bacterium]
MQVRFSNSGPDQTLFYSTLRNRVDGYFTENNISKHCNREMVVKTIILLLAYIVPFVAMLILHPSFLISLVLWLIMGLSAAGVGMSVMHDANHGAYSQNKTVNFWLGGTLNLMGGSIFNWKMQHNLLHHTYTNIHDMDDDIDPKAFMRFSPHSKVRLYHKVQFIYAFFFYGVLTLYWALVKDFIQFAKYKREGINRNTPGENTKVILNMIITKVFYVGIFIFLPIFVFHLPVWNVISGFLLMHFVAGIVLTVVFQLAHTVEGTSHPVPNDKGTIENNWAVHQMNTTVNFSRRNKWISWYVGGLNFQVEHHLFPTICHVHYPNIAGIVKQTAEESGVPYLENITFLNALQSHIRTLKRFGGLPQINEAIA